MMSTSSWIGVPALAIALACQTIYEPPATPLSAAAIEEASGVVQGVAATREDFRVVEGGLWLQAYGYRWVEEDVSAYSHRTDPLGAPVGSLDPVTIRRRVMSGPHDVYVPMDRLLAVRARSWALGSAVELDLEGVPEPAMLEFEGREEAERLAAALDLLRRAGSLP